MKRTVLKCFFISYRRSSLKALRISSDKSSVLMPITFKNSKSTKRRLRQRLRRTFQKSSETFRFRISGLRTRKICNRKKFNISKREFKSFKKIIVRPWMTFKKKA